MADIQVRVDGGSFQGVVAQSVVIENLTLYASALPAQPPPAEIDDGQIPPCPYPGLAYFGPQDSALFFGREAAIEQLKAAVTQRPLTALVGASGTGKSSVVLAGLAPRLHAEGGWRFSHFRIGTEQVKNPFLALARAIVPLYSDHGPVDRLEEIEALAAKLEAGAVTLSNVLGACQAREPGQRILLIADQFEELFTLGVEVGLCRRFIDTLLSGFPDRADGRAPNICLVMTLRADFYGDALRHRPLADALQGHVANLGPMTRAELREAIVRPAGAVSFEGGLVETLLDDVTRRPGSLPLLQFALREMWGRQKKRTVTRSSYDAIGGVEGALAQRAQAIYEASTANGEDHPQVQVFRRLFTRLVTLREDAEDTRRVVGRGELGPEAWALAQRLADESNRLVVTGGETAEVVHEALIRNWPTLVGWIDRDRAFQLWLRGLKPRIEDWRKSPGDEGALLRGGALATAEDWLARRADEISDEEKAYLEACRDAQRVHEAAQKEEQDRRVRDAERIAEEQKKSALAQKRLARATMIVSAVVGLAAVGVWWEYRSAVQATAEAVRAADEAVRSTKLASSREWAAQSRLDLDARAPRNLLLALNSIALTRQVGAFSLTNSRKLLGDLLNSTGGNRLQHEAEVNAVAFSPDGRWLAAANAGDVTLWDMNAPTAAPIALRGADKVNKLVFSPDGRVLATAGEDGAVRLWDMAAADRTTGARVLKGHDGPILDVAVSLNSRWLATAGNDGTARLWDLAARDPAAASMTLPHEPAGRTLNALAFTSDERMLATASSDGGRTTIRLWDLTSAGPPPQPKLIELDADVRKLAFSPDNQWLVAGATETYKAVLMRVAATDKQFLLDVDQWIFRVAFSPDGRWLAIPGHNAARLWDLRKPDPSDEPLFLRGHKGTIADLAFSSDGRWFAAGGDDYTVLLWDMKEPLLMTPTVLRGHEGRITALAFSADERRLATASADRTVRLWSTFSPAAEPLALRSRDGSTRLRIWDLANVSAAPLVLDDDPGQGAGSVFSPDDKWVALISHAKPNFVHVWNLAASPPVRHVLPLRGGISATPVFSPDGRWLVTGGANDPTIRLWDLTSPDPTRNPRRVGGHNRYIRSIAISADGRRLVSGADGGTALVFDLTDPRADPRRLEMGGNATVRTVAISDDGRYVVAGSWEPDYAARIWDLSLPPSTPPIKLSFDNRVFAVAISPDSRWVAAGSWDYTTQLLDLTKPGAKPIILRGHLARILSVAFSPDSQWLATGNEDTTARLWSLAAADPSAESIVLSAPYGIGNVAFSRDSRWLALNPTEQRAVPFGPGTQFASSAPDVRIYRVRLVDLEELACRIAGRNLTADEAPKSDVALDVKICPPNGGKPN